MPVIYKVYWLLHTLAVAISIGITGSYFVIEYNPGKDNKELVLFVTYSALSLLHISFNYMQKWRRKAFSLLHSVSI